MVNYNIQITSSDSLIELPNLTSKHELKRLEWNPKKVSVRKAADVDYEHLQIKKKKDRPQLGGKEL